MTDIKIGDAVKFKEGSTIIPNDWADSLTEILSNTC